MNSNEGIKAITEDTQAIADKLRNAVDVLNEDPANVDEAKFWWFVGEVEDVLTTLDEIGV